MVEIPRFIDHGEEIKLDQLGHKTLYPEKYKDGDLVVKVSIIDDIQRRRNGLNIETIHNVKLSEALKGCEILVRTAHKTETLQLQNFDKDYRHIL